MNQDYKLKLYLLFWKPEHRVTKTPISRIRELPKLTNPEVRRIMAENQSVHELVMKSNTELK